MNDARTGTLRYSAVAHALWSLRTPSFFEEVRPAERAVSYRARAPRGVAPLLDIYAPSGSKGGASVVLVHGGGFVLGSRGMKPMRFLASCLTAAGVAVCTVDYRLIFRGGRLDEAVDDVRTALAFWRERAPRYDLDPARVSLVGLSAGGMLAMLAAAHEDAALYRLASAFGLYDPAHLSGRLAQIVPRLLFRTAERDVWRQRSPAGSPQPRVPTLLLHGTADGLVPVDQARRLAAQREASGLPTRLVLYADAPHGFFNYPSPVAQRGAEEIVRHVLGAPLDESPVRPTTGRRSSAPTRS